MLVDALVHLHRVQLQRHGFQSRRVPTSAGTVHVLDAKGRGPLPPLVILHGINSWGGNYRKVLPRLLARAQRVIVPDLPGHGLSEVPPRLSPESLRLGVLEAFDAVVDAPVVLFGNSMGGAGAVQLAVARPDRIRGLILNSPGGALQSRDDLHAFLDSFRFRGNRDAARFVGQIHLHPPWYRHLIAPAVRQAFDRPELRGFIDALRPEDLIQPADLEQLRMPVLLLWGKADRLMPEAHRAFYRAHLPAHTVWEEPDDFGHCPYQDRPDALADRILAFAEQVGAA